MRRYAHCSTRPPQRKLRFSRDFRARPRFGYVRLTRTPYTISDAMRKAYRVEEAAEQN